MQARHELNGRLTEMINLTQQLPWPRTLFLLLPLGFLPSFLLFLEARYTTVTLNVSWCNHTVVRREMAFDKILYMCKRRTFTNPAFFVDIFGRAPRTAFERYILICSSSKVTILLFTASSQ